MASKLINSQYLLDTGGSVEVQGAERKPVSSLIVGDVIIFQNQIISITSIAESDEVRSDAVPTSWIGTTAGKLVELDGSARIPAVDGSLVTNVIHTEVDPTGLKISNNLSDLNNAGTARTNLGGVCALTAGTSAGNLVQLNPFDGSLPAVDGSNLTGLAAGGNVDITAVAGQTLDASAGDVVARIVLNATTGADADKTDGRAYKTDGDISASAAGAVIIGLVQGGASVSAGTSFTLRIAGTHTTSGLTAGARYYTSGTAGELVTTNPSSGIEVGVAISATKLIVNPRYLVTSSDGGIPAPTVYWPMNDNSATNAWTLLNLGVGRTTAYNGTLGDGALGQSSSWTTSTVQSVEGSGGSSRAVVQFTDTGNQNGFTASGFTNGETTYTISMWIFANTAFSNWNGHRIYTLDNGAGVDPVSNSGSTTKLAAPGSGSYTDNLNVDQWYHIVLAQTGTSEKLWIDGALEVEATGVTQHEWGSELTFTGLGNQGGGSAYSWQGMACEFAIWLGTELSQTHVTDLFNGGAPLDLTQPAP